MTTPLLKMRARACGLDLNGTPGAWNAITDVAGVAVGFKTLLENEPRVGRKLPLRSGVTAIRPHAQSAEPVPVYAGIHRFNGNGEMTGSHWIEDGGYFLGPVVLTNTHSVGMAHHASVKWMLQHYKTTYDVGEDLWMMPVIAETYDGLLSDINGQHITEADVFAALNSAATGAVAEGCVGGGTGMICYGWKGGTGTSSRVLNIAGQSHTLGVLVQANHGVSEWLTITGVPVGRHLAPPSAGANPVERGSIIVVIATDLPMAPHQLKRLARRAAIGIGRNGTPGGNNSGDIFLAFSTANPRPMPHKEPAKFTIEMLSDELFDPVYMAAVDAVEEAVLNAMFAAIDTGGTAYDRAFVPALPIEEVRGLLSRQGRIKL